MKPDEKTRYLKFWGYKLGTPEAEQAWSEKCAMTHRQSAAVITDIEAYQSMVTGEMIEGRKAHREHLKRHNLVELGNETLNPPKVREPAGNLKEQIARQVYSKLRY